MNEFSEAEFLSNTISNRNKSYNLKIQGNLEKEKIIDTALQLFSFIKEKDGVGIQKINDELTLNNAKYDTDIIRHGNFVLVNADDFSTCIRPLKDGALVLHCERMNATQIVNAKHFDGTIVLQGDFEIVNARVYDAKDKLIQNQYVNITLLKDTNTDAFFEAPEYISEIKEKVLEKKGILAELNLDNLKASAKKCEENDNEYKCIDDNQLQKDFEKGSKRIPNLLNSIAKSYKKGIRKIECNKRTKKTKRVLNYMKNTSNIDFLTNALDAFDKICY